MALSNNERQQRWRDRRKAERIAAAKEEKRQRRLALDAARAAKGLRRALTPNEKAAQYQARKAAIERWVLDQWFSPNILIEEAEAIAKARYSLDSQSMFRMNYVVGEQRECRKVGLNLNKFTMQSDGVRQALEQRLLLNEILRERGVGIIEALVFAKDAQYQPEGSDEISRIQNRQRALECAKALGTGSSVLAAVLACKPAQLKLLVKFI